MEREEVMDDIQCPKRIIIGDPVFFDEGTERERKYLTVDYKPPKDFGIEVVVVEQEAEKNAQQSDGRPVCSITMTFAPKKYMPDSIGKYIETLHAMKIKQKMIVIDSNRYLIDIDGRKEEIATNKDRAWGVYGELYCQDENGNHITQGVIIDMTLPETINFEKAKQIAKHLFKKEKQLEKQAPKKTVKRQER